MDHLLVLIKEISRKNSLSCKILFVLKLPIRHYFVTSFIMFFIMNDDMFGNFKSKQILNETEFILEISLLSQVGKIVIHCRNRNWQHIYIYNMWAHVRKAVGSPQNTAIHFRNMNGE